VEKSCENCYWTPCGSSKWCLHKEEKPEENICDEHSHQCNECNSLAEYKYDGKYYCEDCIIGEFQVETYDVKHFYMDGCSLGTDDDMSEVICNLDSGIETLD